MPDYRLVPFETNLALPTVRLWRRAFEVAMGLPVTNGPDTAYAEQLEYLESLYPDHKMTHVLHPRSPRVLGFMAQRGAWVEHLYLSPAVQGQGLGRALLAQAQQRSPEELNLYTFTANQGARAFYKACGFAEVAFGRADPEQNPWSTHPEQLDDVLLRWHGAS